MKHYTHYQPKEKGKSDFYSWNLFRWLRKQDKQTDWLKKTSIYKHDDGTLFIGTRYNPEDDGWVTGFKLRQLCSGSGSDRFPNVGAWAGSHKWQDVTDWFWPEYECIGVCAIWGDMSHRWEYSIDDSARTCQNCGKVEEKKIEIELVERVTWEDAE